MLEDQGTARPNRDGHGDRRTLAEKTLPGPSTSSLSRTPGQRAAKAEAPAKVRTAPRLGQPAAPQCAE